MNTIRDYFTHDKTVDRSKLDPLLVELADLARGCAREGHLTLAIMPRCCSTISGCLVCGSTDHNMPMRRPVGHRMTVALYCDICQKRVPQLQDATIAKLIRERAVPGPYDSIEQEMAYLFQDGPRLRLVWGQNINTEALS
jgi:hypothetical protein